MKKTPLRPSTKRIERRTPMATVNRKRKAASIARAYGKHRAWIIRQRCIVAEHTESGYRDCRGDVVPAHTANGGMSRKGDASTLVPACAGHHTLNTISMHNGERTFERHYGLDLKALAAAFWQRSPANPGNQEPAA